MRHFTTHRRWVATAVLAASVMLAMASLAEAGHRRYRGENRVRVVRYDSRPGWESRRVYTRSSGAFPAFAGFVGGLIVGSALADHPHVSARVTYWDPDCGRAFPSMDAYYSYWGSWHRPRRVQMIEVPSGYDWYDYHCDRYGRSYWGDRCPYEDEDYDDN